MEKILKVGSTINTVWGSYYQVTKIEDDKIYAASIISATGKVSKNSSEMKPESIQVDMYEGATCAKFSYEPEPMAILKIIKPNKRKQ